MKLIAHRGNINGISNEENNPNYIVSTIIQGYEVEIDLWYKNNKWFLGHDYPQYEINFHFLDIYSQVLWIHCKDYNTLQSLVPYKKNFNFFYHTDEDYVLTSQGWIWAYPNMPGSNYTICVMPEWNNQFVDGFAGVCSDFVEKYK